MKKPLFAIIAVVILCIILWPKLALKYKDIQNDNTPAYTSPADKFEKALYEGNLAEAESILREIDADCGRHIYAKMLIEEYLSQNELDKAILVYERITPYHCSRYQMNFDNLYGLDGYEIAVTAKLRKALVKADRFEEAWDYYPLEYESETYAGNASSYFRYMSDVIVHLCSQNRKSEAQMFLNSHVNWFRANVDNGEWGEDYPQYSYVNMKSQLQDIIDTY